MLASNGESSVIINHDVALSELHYYNHDRMEEDSFQFIQTSPCDVITDHSHGDDSLENFLPINHEYTAHEFEEFFSANNCDMSPITSESLLSPPAQIDFVSFMPIKDECNDHFSYGQQYQLEFINPPEENYHVRYQSEITSHPLDGNIVNTRKKTKKNISGRYLKGRQSRHVMIALPTLHIPYQNLFIRVTRLTLPYQGNFYIHPYPLLYSTPKKKSQCEVITNDPSIYYRLTKEDVREGAKKFPNMILTRLKQCQLKQIHSLKLFDSVGTIHPFLGENAKNKIALYQLKKSQLDFRLVEFCPRTNEFIDKGISCLTSPLTEEEGTECRKGSPHSARLSMQF